MRQKEEVTMGYNNNDLTKTNGNISPDAAIFTVSDKQISNYYLDFFGPKIDGFKTLRLFAKKGSSGAQLQCFAFIDANSRNVRTSKNVAQGQDISPVFKGKLEQQTNVSGEFANVFRPFAFNGDPKAVIKERNGQKLVCIELDPFAILGYFLSVEKSSQELVITHVEIINRRTNQISIRCCKRYRDVVTDRDFNDVYNDIYQSQLARK